MIPHTTKDEDAHKAEADVLAALLVLDGQAERYDDLARTVADLRLYTDWPEIVDADGKFVRNEGGVIAFAFSDHAGKPVDEVARADPGLLKWMLREDYSDEEGCCT
jgi:DNA polymerase-3 subunit epsilon